MNTVINVLKWQSKKQGKKSGKPSDKPPRQSDHSKSNCADSDVPDDAQAILAFRTITTMLSLIQSPITGTIDARRKDIPQTDAQRYQLRVLDAMAAVVVRANEIVAIAAKQYDGSSIQVLASVVHLDAFEPILTIHQPDEGQWNLFRWFLVTPNPRDPKKNPSSPIDSLTTDTDLTLVDPDIKVSKELSEASGVPLLKLFLNTHWGKESFDTHVWMLKTFLGLSAEDRHTLELYVIAVSFPKMLTRMEHPLSASYLDCLVKLTAFEYVEQPHVAPTREDERSRDQLFLHIIPDLATVAETKIPNLQRVAEAAKAKEPFEVYNKDTYMEFHRLLCEMLQRFHSSLNSLKTLQKAMVESGQYKLDKIEAGLARVQIMGRQLRAMIRGGAMVKHLKTIAPLLEEDIGRLWGMTDEEDVEFCSLRPYTITQGRPLLPWQSYKDWLMLMVLYFDATQVLSKHVRSLHLPSPVDVSIKILSPPRPDLKMLTWRDLLRHERYFPKLPNKPLQPSAEELITFLTSDFETPTEGTCVDREPETSLSGGKQGSRSQKSKGASIEQVVMSVQRLKERQELDIPSEGVSIDLTQDIDLIIKQMSSLKNCSSPGWGEFTAAILDRLDHLRDHDTTPKRRLTLTQQIAEMLDAFRGHSTLYQMLKKDTPLSRGEHFAGTRHCEICLAALEALSSRPDSKLEALLRSALADCGQTIGVSKRCCPVCARVLRLLTTYDGKMFITTGEHSKITPCTLPEWLPTEIVQAMAVEFGGRLREELVNLQQRTELLRARTRSTDTRRMSLDSLGRSEGPDSHPFSNSHPISNQDAMNNSFQEPFY